MKSFKDDQGRVWHPRVTVLTLRRMLDEVDVSLFEEGNGSASKQVFELIPLIPLTVGREMLERSVTAEELLDSLSSEELFAAACDAVGEAINDFFASSARRTQDPGKE